MKQQVIIGIWLIAAIIAIIVYLRVFIKELIKFLEYKKFIIKFSTNCSSLFDTYNLCPSVIRSSDFLKKSNSDDGAISKDQEIEPIHYSVDAEFSEKNELISNQNVNNGKLNKAEDIAIKVWTTICIYYDSIIDSAQSNSPTCNIVFQNDKRDDFIQSFCEYYDYIIKKYMKDDVVSLDSHKQTAIIIASIIENEIFIADKDNIPEDCIFLGAQVMALSVGLGYMQTILNNRLKKHSYRIDSYTMPHPFSCETGYFDVLCRSLYVEMEENKKINILTLANTLFLIECVTLQANNIDLAVLEHGNKDK